MDESIAAFKTKLMYQRKFASRTIPRNCMYNCGDPHPKVQALMAADHATMMAVGEWNSFKDSYQYFEVQ